MGLVQLIHQLKSLYLRLTRTVSLKCENKDKGESFFFILSININHMELLFLYSGIYALKVESQKGSSVASFFLGMAFEQGYLVNKNLNTARIYYQRAADAGNPEAEFNLAVFYSKGWGGLAKSEEKSLALLHRAAEAGLVKAQNALGLDIKVDLEEEKKSARDLYMLGRSFEDLGEVGVALEMYKKAEKAGYSRAGRARVRLSSLSS